MTCTMEDFHPDPDMFFVEVEGLQRRLKAQGQAYSDEMIKDLVIGNKLSEKKYHSLLTGFQFKKKASRRFRMRT